ncbi:MAG: DUF1653 domain-containing protein [archaeon]
MNREKNQDNIVIKLGLYQHFKGGLYDVLGEATPSGKLDMLKSFEDARFSEEPMALVPILQTTDGAYRYDPRDLADVPEGSKVVIYRALYDSDEFGPNVLWVRPKKLFIDMKNIDGKEVPRFAYLGED